MKNLLFEHHFECHLVYLSGSVEEAVVSVSRAQRREEIHKMNIWETSAQMAVKALGV